MPRIFTDLVDMSAFYIHVISRNKLARLGKGYSKIVSDILTLFILVCFVSFSMPRLLLQGVPYLLRTHKTDYISSCVTDTKKLCISYDSPTY